MNLNFKGPLVDLNMLLDIVGHNCKNNLVGPALYSSLCFCPGTLFKHFYSNLLATAYPRQKQI